MANVLLCLELRTGWQRMGASEGGGWRGWGVREKGLPADGPGRAAVSLQSCEPSTALPSVRLQ